MKIFYFVSTFPYKNPITGEATNNLQNDGGVENVAYQLVLEIAKRGHEVLIFTSSIDSTSYIEDYGNIKIYRYKKAFTIGLAPISLELIYKPLLYRDDADIIHTHLGNLPAPLTAVFYAKMKKIPLIVTHHGDWIGGFGSFMRRFGVFIYNNFLCNYILSSADSIIALSEGHINDSLFLGKYLSKISVISNGVSISKFELSYTTNESRKLLNLPIEKNIILFVGSLTFRKGPHVLLNAMKKVLQKWPESYLIFVGDGNLITELYSMSKDLKIDSNVRFTGFVNEIDKILYYKAADMFVLPSFLEAFPLTLMEASASGLPLIGSDLECFKSIIDDQRTGLVFKKGDVDDLADKIIYLLDNSDVRKIMGNNAKKKIIEFDWEKVVEKTERLYLNSISRFYE